jgi:hypothetical protein
MLVRLYDRGLPEASRRWACGDVEEAHAGIDVPVTC